MKSILILTSSLILNCTSVLAQSSTLQPQVKPSQNSYSNPNEPQINQVNFGNSQFPTYYGNGSQNPINITGNVQINPSGTSYILGLQWGFGGQSQPDTAREQLRNICVQKLMINQLTQPIINACLEVGSPGFNQFKK